MKKLDSRRKFLSMAGLSAISLGLSWRELFAKDYVKNKLALNSNIPKLSLPKRILPQGLKVGSTVAIAAPASPTSIGEISTGRNYFQSLGCKVIVGDIITKNRNATRYFSAPDEERAEEFMSFIKNPEVDAIVCGRGGYGTMRILPYLDFNEIKANPKIIMGFSDITALLNAIHKKTGLVTYHGPVASSSYNGFNENNLKNLIFDDYNNDDYLMNANQAIVINEGISAGQLVGGNLTMLSTTLGTEYEIDTSGKILFIEETAEHAYQVDRMITQLILANKIQAASGVLFGYFNNLNIRGSFYPNRGYTILEVIEQLVKPTKVPCMVGFPFGHSINKLTLPIGIAAEMDTQKKLLQFTEKSVI